MITQAYLYKWIHILTGKYYVGCRTAKGCHPNDGYICSSKLVKPLIEQSPLYWVREILAIGEPKEIVHLETEYLQMYDCKNDPMSYNRHNNDGFFGPTIGPMSEEHKKNMSRSLKGKKKPPRTEEHRKKLGKSRKNIPAWNKGKKMRPRTEEEKNKISEGMKRWHKELKMKRESC